MDPQLVLADGKDARPEPWYVRMCGPFLFHPPHARHLPPTLLPVVPLVDGPLLMCWLPTPLHPQVGGLVTGARERLRLMSAAAPCAHVRLVFVLTRLLSPRGLTVSPHNDRVLTHLTCACDPTRAPAGRWMRGWLSPTAWVRDRSQGGCILGVMCRQGAPNFAS